VLGLSRLCSSILESGAIGGTLRGCGFLGESIAPILLLIITGGQTADLDFRSQPNEINLHTGV